MGFYINELEDGTPLPKIGKADFLLENVDAAYETMLPIRFAGIRYNIALIAVVENGLFDAAAYVDDHLFKEIVLERSNKHTRPIRFIAINRKLGMKLSGVDKYLKA